MDFKHWKYFLLLEQDFINTMRYVELSPNNFQTYSIEYTKLILTACSEIDILCKQLCSIIGNDKADNIKDYETCILTKYPKFFSNTITLTPEITLTPWANWQNNASPKWWKDYNAIKHERINNFEKSNLFTTINCLSALMLTNLYYSKALYGLFPDQSTNLFDDNYFPARRITETGSKILCDFK